MSKRPSIDLAALTSEAAAPMSEAAQRAPRPAPGEVTPPPAKRQSVQVPTKTANLEALAFKVPPAFRKRFRQDAANSDLKLNELLFEALDAWEDKRGIKR